VDLHIHFSSGAGNKKKEMVIVVLAVMRGYVDKLDYQSFSIFTK
jgi:hypothetical protein